MFQAKRTLFQLTTKSSLLKTSVRYNSSSVGKLNNALPSTSTTTTATTTTTDKDNNQMSKANSNVELDNSNKQKIPFMPVINIPETEFAHHSFFSLHRPLLGLSDEDETPFFSQKQPKSVEDREQEKMDTMLAVYMNNCVPFVEPHKLSSQGEEWKDEFSEAFDNAEKESEKTQVSMKVSEDFQDFQDLFGDEELLEQVETQPIDNNNRPLPMFHMPESNDVLDYLTSMESKMKQEHAKLDAEDKLKALRLKKLEILSDVSNNRRNKPRFYATHGRNVHQRLRRYQQKWLLK